MKKILFTTLVMTLCASCLNIHPDEDVLVVGDSLPAVLNDYKSGEALIVLFSISCPDCKKELPIVNDLYLSYPTVKFIAIGRDHKTSEIRDYWTEQKYSIPYLEDPDRQIYNQLANSIVPRCYYCRNGIIKKLWKDNPVMTKEDFLEARQE